MHLGCRIGLAVGRLCQSPTAGWCWAVFRRNHRRRSATACFGVRPAARRWAQPVQFDGDTVEPTDRLALEIGPSSLTLAVPEHHQDQTPPVRQDPD